MKTVRKSFIDRLIKQTKQYNNLNFGEGDTFLDKANTYAKMLELETGVCWCSWRDLISSILRGRGFNEYASNHDIYNCLKALGWVVVDD